MKKHARSNYYDNIDIYLHEAHNNNSKLYWKLLKDTFKTNPTSNIPPIHHTSEDGDNFVAFSDVEKVDLLNSYFSSKCTVHDTDHDLPSMYSLCNNRLSSIIIEEEEIIDIISIFFPLTKLLGLTASVTKC